MSPSDLSDLEILILTLIGESRGEPIEGQVAVGAVIRNRVNSWNKSYKDVCLQPKQFSCWNADDPNRILLDELGDGLIVGNRLNNPEHIQCQYVALGIIKNNILDNTHGALNYMTTNLFTSDSRPEWAQNVRFAITKGNQTFFKV